MERYTRLDTEGLIQECREGFDAARSQERVQELELLLHLRNE
jgi:hypothetical protein